MPRINSLGLGQSELQLVLDELDRHEPDAAIRKRDSSRLAFRLMSVNAEITQPGGSGRSVQVATRNISQNNVCFLHSSYLHESTPCVLHLPRIVGEPRRAKGVVVGCRHISRHIHEVDIAFKDPIDVREHIEIDVLSQSFGRDRVDPASLVGSLLLVSECRFQSAALQAMLSSTKLTVTHVPDMQQTLSKASSGSYDIVLCDLEFCGVVATELTRQIRAAGQACPILVMSPDTSSTARQRVRSSGADGFVALPPTPEALLGTLAEFLSHNRDRGRSSGEIRTTLPQDSALRNEANAFVTALAGFRTELQAAANKNDAEAVRSITLRLVASAGLLGFEPIAAAASSLVHALAATMSVQESSKELAALLSACAAARA